MLLKRFPEHALGSPIIRCVCENDSCQGKHLISNQAKQDVLSLVATKIR